MTYIWSDGFDNDYFATRYTDGFGFVIGALDPTQGAGAVGNSQLSVAATLVHVGGGTGLSTGLDWNDRTKLLPADCTRARIWLDVASTDDQGYMQIGFRNRYVFNTLRRDAVGDTPTMPKAATTFDADDIVGAQVGVNLSGTDELWVGSGSDQFQGGGASPLQTISPSTPFTAGHFELAVTSDGVATVTTPDETLTAQLAANVFPNLVGDFPYVELITSTPQLQPVGSIVLDGWGYEFQTPVLPSTVVAGQGQAGALRH